ncbi:MAG: GNAT family N-acetyltransferase [Clostridia bacterium]|nr:GNAT family N-acetyltransferase [Clostridia bacterium]
MICAYTVGDLTALMREEIISLHSETFADSRAWICDFLTAAREERYLAYLADGQLLGGMFLLSAALRDEKIYRGDYIFALCVRPAARGRGIATSLLRFAKDGAKDFLLLVPASADLIGFYTARGFTVRLPACTSADGRGARADLSACGAIEHADAYALAEICGGLLLGAPLCAYALRERGLSLLQEKNTLFAVKDGEIFAAFGKDLLQKLHGVKEGKALAYVRGGTLPPVLCDLLFEE